MRNLTEEQALEVAFDVVYDHLRAGVEYLDVTGAVDECAFGEEEQPTDEDYRSVANHVQNLMDKLLDELVELQ